MLDAVRAATEGTPQEVVAQVAHTVQGMARLGKDMADVKYEVHKLMKVPKGGAEVAGLREEFAEVKSEVAKLAEHPAYTQGGPAAWKSMKEEVTEARKEGEKVKGGVVEAKKEIEDLREEVISTVNT